MTRRAEWQLSTLGDLCSLRGGAAFSPSLQGREAGDLPFIKVRDFNSAQNAIRINGSHNWVMTEDASKIQGKSFPAGTYLPLRQRRLGSVHQEDCVGRQERRSRAPVRN
jgi:hypothetical protein